jgi:hypothetical protein
MRGQSVQFARHYRAALLDHLLNRNEAGLERALLLGRRAVAGGLGVLHVVHTHHEAINAVLRCTRAGDERLAQLRAAQDFLIEALAVYEMTHRGFVERRDRRAGRDRRSETHAAEPDGTPELCDT